MLRQAALILWILGGLTGGAQASVLPVHVFKPLSDIQSDGGGTVPSRDRTGKYPVASVSINDRGYDRNFTGGALQGGTGFFDRGLDPFGISQAEGEFHVKIGVHDIDNVSGVHLDTSPQVGVENTSFGRPDVNVLSPEKAFVLIWKETDGSESYARAVSNEKFLPLHFLLFFQNVGLLPGNEHLTSVDGGLSGGDFQAQAGGPIRLSKIEQLGGPEQNKGDSRTEKSGGVARKLPSKLGERWVLGAVLLALAWAGCFVTGSIALKFGDRAAAKLFMAAGTALVCCFLGLAFYE